VPQADPLVWDAKWISLSPDPREDLGVFGFRRRIELDEVPQELLVRVSADQRYKLYVNGELVGFGPQRGDPQHWFYETYDLAPFLQVGENWIAALVWNFGRWAPMAQMSARTGFVLEGKGLSTPDGWQVLRLESWGFDMLHSHHLDWYIDVGPGEIIDLRGAPWGWRTGDDGWPEQEDVQIPEEAQVVASDPFPHARARPGASEPNQPELSDPAVPSHNEVPSAAWRAPNVVCHAEDRGATGGGTPWMLIPRSIPPMEYRIRAVMPKVRHGFLGDPSPGGEETELRKPWSLAVGARVLLDFGELLCAYPRLTLEGPPGATLTLTYAEALWHPDGTKGDRNDVAGKEVRGYQDRIILDGESRTIETLWWRTFRYLLLEVTSLLEVEVGEPGPPKNPGRGSSSPLEGEDLPREYGEEVGGSASQPPTPARSARSPSPSRGEGIVLISIDAIETGYPLQVESSFDADDPWVRPIWDVAVRTAERCAGETYFDCPYYEQLQYVGDTRIQALIGYYLGRDRALQRNAVETLGWSLMENGLTQSRYPSRQTQVIPPFSLWWVMMVWDQMMHDPLWNGADPTGRFSRWAEAAQGVLSSYHRLTRGSGSFWPFCDWVPEWKWGAPLLSANAREHRLLVLLATLACPALSRVAKTLENMRSDETLLLKGDFGLSKRDFEEFLGARPASLSFPSSMPIELRSSLAAAVDHEAVIELGSEQAEALKGVLALQAGLDPDPWPTEALAKANAAKCTYYFSYYKHLAMFGRPEHSEAKPNEPEPTRSNPSASYPFDYLQELAPWKQMIEDGLTTFAETPEPTRSDCHAWSAHPILGFFQIVAGVTSVSPGWKKARIMPHPGSLRRFDARIAHPDGELTVRYEDGKLSIDSPVPFELRWRGRKDEFPAGRAEA